MKKKVALVLGIAALAALGVAGGASASSCWYSPRGCVSVGGYWKPSTRTYVRPYFRNYPGYGSYSYSYRPSYGYGYGYGW